MVNRSVSKISLEKESETHRAIYLINEDVYYYSDTMIGIAII